MADKGKKAVEKKAKALKKLAVEYVPVTKLSPNTYNPNRQSDHDFELLLRSMEEDGFTQPIVAMQGGEIVDGEHRWTGWTVLQEIVRQGKRVDDYSTADLRELRDRRLDLLQEDVEVPVVFTDMTPEQMRIATLRHNRARGSEDIELTTQVLRDLEQLGALDWAQSSLMMDDDEINRLLEDIPVPEMLADEEYGSAWEPEQTQEWERGIEDTEAVKVDRKTGTTVSALSQRAVQDMRDREKAIKEAKTEEEREAVKKDNAFFRLQLLFSGEEATLVQSVLGSRPAERLVELCRDAEPVEV